MRKLLAILFLFTVALVNAQELQTRADTIISTYTVNYSTDSITAHAWGLTGNAGTNPATNFIGTTDDVDLVFKRNNRAYGYFGGTNLALGDSAGFYHGLLGGDYNIFLGYGAGKHDAPSGAIGNIAIGYRTLEVNPASYNIAIGYEALEANTTNGAANIAIGLTAGKLNTSGELNTFVGNSSGSINTTGGHNSFFGDNSGVTNTTGSYNSFFGDGASGLYDTTSYSTAIGVEALSAFKSVAVGYKSRALVPNTIILGDTNTLTGVGIGTVYPSAKLDVRGTIRIVDGTQGLGYVLTSDSQGLASWNATTYTALDSVTIYASTPTAGTVYRCSDCVANGLTGASIVSYLASAWRRIFN